MILKFSFQAAEYIFWYLKTYFLKELKLPVLLSNVWFYQEIHPESGQQT